MLHGFQKKILPIVLSLALILNLILIPGIHSQAATYSTETSFTYTYDGYNYQFYYSGTTDVPDGYRFDSSALDYLLQKSAEGINISISAGLGSKISGLLSSGLSSVFNLYRNFVIATDKLVADWIVWDDIYGFEFQYTGVDPSYPGFETYGSAYGWTFIGWLGEKIDLVLDSQGMLYGSNPIGNYTFSDDQLDIGRWSIHQYEAQGGQFWVPDVYVSSFGDLDLPYFDGNTLVFYAYEGTVKHECRITNFENCICVYSPYNASGQVYYPGNLGFIDYQANGSISNSNRLYIDGTPNNLGRSGRKVTYTYKGLYHYQNYMLLWNFNDWNLSVNLPMYTLPNNSITSLGTIANGNVKGLLNSSPVNGTCQLLYLSSFSTSPLPDPIDLPVDDPIPVSDIQPDPIDFTPDPDEDPDPVPGVDYPGDDPQPVPVPPLPPLVSGNDDLWPDMNGVFEVESEIDGFLGGLSNFEFTPLRTLVEGFSSSLIWVSTIMMALYNGSDFSILFVVLSIFFIAAALLGIYKWWTH